MSAKRLVVAGGSGFLGSHAMHSRKLGHRTVLTMPPYDSRIPNLQVGSGQGLVGNIPEVWPTDIQSANAPYLKSQSIRRTALGYRHKLA